MVGQEQQEQQGSEHSTKIDEATERAADTVRKAAARAAADRARARTRTSVLSAMGMALGVIAVLTVATGLLAVLGVLIGVLALLVSVGGVTATGNRHPYLAGRYLSVVGLLLAAIAILVGILAATGLMPALDTDTNLVQRLHDQLPSWLS